MRFSLSSTALSSSLSSLSRVINSKNTMQILDCFLFEIKDGQLVVTASDGENVMTAQIPLDETDGNHRVTCIDRLVFEKDGTIRPVKITFEGVAKTRLK